MKNKSKCNDHCVKLANERFGLEVLCKELMSNLNCCDNTKERIINLAKSRDFNECTSVIDEVKSTKAYTVTIKHITSAMRANNENA